MYYRSVNRGITLTGPGRNTVGLVFILGLVAIASGYNAVYLGLALGCSVLIVSGVLSERLIKDSRLRSTSEVQVDAHREFSISLVIENRNPTHPIYGIEAEVFLSDPQLGLWRRQRKPITSALLLELDGGREARISGSCGGLKRGVYKEIFVLQKTLHPFGLLSKFKVSRSTSGITVIPEVDLALQEWLRTELRQRTASGQAEEEFHSHRHYVRIDPVRKIDWKRSAGRKIEDWVVKQYESREFDWGVSIEISPEELAAASENELERRLSLVRTVAEVCREFGRNVYLDLHGAGVLEGYEEIVQFLAAYNQKDAGALLSQGSVGVLPEIPLLRFQLKGERVGVI